MSMSIEQTRLSRKLLSVVKAMVPEGVFYEYGDSPCYYGDELYSYNKPDSHLWEVNFDRNYKGESKEAFIVAELAQAGILAKVVGNYPKRLSIDTTQAGLADNIAKLMEQHRDGILQAVQAEMQRTNDLNYTAINYIDESIPQLPNGRALDPESAAAFVADHERQLAALKKQLGIENMVDALVSPRSGRARAADE